MLKEFIVVFIITFIVTSFVTLIYNLLFHADVLFEWATAFRLSIILGIIFPTLNYRERKKLG